MFSSLVVANRGGFETTEFADVPSEISVFELGGCENGENARTVDDFEPGSAVLVMCLGGPKPQAQSENIRVDYSY